MRGRVCNGLAGARTCAQRHRIGGTGFGAGTNGGALLAEGPGIGANRRSVITEGPAATADRYRIGRADAEEAKAGLGTITPASGFVAPWHGIVIGIVAGGICFWACTSLKHRLNYDDSLDVFGIHGIGGLAGTLMAGIFATAAIGGTAGLLEGNWVQPLLQLYGIAVTLLWTAVAVLVAGSIALFAGFRIEGRRPGWLTAPPGLLVGPLWVLASLYRRMGWKY